MKVADSENAVTSSNTTPGDVEFSMSRFEALFERANSADNAERNDEARALWQQCVAMAPQFGLVWFKYGCFLHNQGEYEAALAAAARAIRCRNFIPSISARCRMLIGRCYDRLGKSHTAERFLRRALKIESRGEIYHSLAQVLWCQDRDLEAIATLQQGIEMHPDDGELRADLGGYFCTLKDYQTAKIHLCRAIELGHEDAEVYTNLSRVFQQGKNRSWQDAKLMLKKALTLDPNNLWALVYSANLWWRLRDDEAEKQYQTALRLWPDEAVTNFTYGDFLSVTERDLERADQLLHHAVKLDAHMAGAQYSLGKHLWRQYRDEEARAAFSAAAQIGHQRAQQRLDEMNTEAEQDKT